MQSEENRTIAESSATEASPDTDRPLPSEYSPEMDSPLPDIPEDEVHAFERLMGTSLQMTGAAIPSHPLADKITSDHITTLIDNSLAESR